MGAECIRRAGSEWTRCACEPCRVEMRRKSKHARSGLRPVDHRDAAWARVVAWVEAGYSMGLVEDMAGVGHMVACRMFQAVRAGQRGTILHATADRIMAAPAQPTDAGWLPSTGTYRRLRALTVMGWSMADLAARCDVSESTLHDLRSPRHKHTRPRFAATVTRLYDDIAMTKGPSHLATARAIKKGWPPPLAWDDIDDPNQQPNLGDRPQAGAQAENIAWLLRHDAALTARQVGERLGISGDGVDQALRRYGRQDLIDQMANNAARLTA